MTSADDKLHCISMKAVRQINQCYKATPEIIRKYLRFHWRKQVIHLDDCALIAFLEKALDRAVCVGYLDTDGCGKYWVKGTCSIPSCPPPCPPPPCPDKITCPPCAPPCKAPCPKPCPCPPKPCPPCPPPCCPPPCPKCPELNVAHLPAPGRSKKVRLM